MLNKMTVCKEMVHETYFSPGRVRETDACPSMIILYGKIQIEDRQFLGDHKDGHRQDHGRNLQGRAALICLEHTR